MATSEHNGQMIFKDASGNLSVLYPATKAEQVDGLQALLDAKAAASTLTSHINNKSNPHGVTAAQIGAAASSHKHAAGDITSGTLSSDRLPTVPISKGGTGATTAAAALTALGAAAASHTHSNYAPKASPALTGTPTAPTAAAGTNSTQIATTAFVQNALSSGGGNEIILDYANTAHQYVTSSSQTGTQITLTDAFRTAAINKNIAFNINVPIDASEWESASYYERIIYGYTASGSLLFSVAAIASPYHNYNDTGAVFFNMKNNSYITMPHGYSYSTTASPQDYLGAKLQSFDFSNCAYLQIGNSCKGVYTYQSTFNVKVTAVAF